MSFPAIATDTAGILVKFRDGGHFAATNGRSIGHGVHLLDSGDGTRGGETRGIADRLAALRADPAVLYAEPNYSGRFADKPAPVALPDDPGYARQDWLEAVGARQAWAVSTGKGITVAVVDSGVDLTHPDLLDNLLTNGFSTGDNAANVQDRLGHGTFVAGIVAARRSNAFAGSGLAPDAKILPVKISTGYAASFSAATLAQGIDYATRHGAHIINLSLYLDSSSQTVSDAIQRALDAGVIVIAAAGNEGGSVAFPGSMQDVIAVAAVDANGVLLANSNSGPEIAVAAYGGGVTSTLLHGGFGVNGAGTSFAAPMVAATAANLLQIDKRLDRGTLIDILTTSTHPLSASSSAAIGTVGPSYGVLDAGKAALALLPDLRPQPANVDLFVDYLLPPTAGPVDVYVATTTPFGELGLHPDGTWSPMAGGNRVPVATGYRSSAAATGALFGGAGGFPAVDLTGMPNGIYELRIGMTIAGTDTLIGPVVTSPWSVAHWCQVAENAHRDCHTWLHYQASRLRQLALKVFPLTGIYSGSFMSLALTTRTQAATTAGSKALLTRTPIN